MSEVEREESKKTVVAFITGLLIGGLLVWVFSSSPAAEAPVDGASDDTKEVTLEGATAEKVADAAPKAETAVSGTGSIKVVDQKAGKLVVLGTLEYPAAGGWVVVRDYMDGVPGNILGAARYSTEEGLTPTAVELIRETTAGSSYQVVFYTNEGAPEFATGEDKPVEGISATFKAN